MSSDGEGYVSERGFFLAVSIMLLVLTTARFDQDVWSFFFSLVVIAGVMYFDD